MRAEMLAGSISISVARRIDRTACRIAIIQKQMTAVWLFLNLVRGREGNDGQR